ncbi:MAG TPA: hypothetical protein PLP09_10850, partial [Petrotogaceae bacterium]|nr:hypothetical protein [Petrotogaceae bacterium]
IEQAKNYNFCVKYWEEFVAYLKQATFPQEINEYIQGYIKYVTEVCNIVELKKIDFNKLNSLFFFNNLVKKTISEFVKEDLKIDLYSTPRAFGPGYSGQYFSLKKLQGTNEVYPWFGIWYGYTDENEENEPIIYIAFEKDWCNIIYDKFKNSAIRGNMFNVETNESPKEVIFRLNKAFFDEFKKEDTTLERQKEILSSFFKEVINVVKKYLL